MISFELLLTTYWPQTSLILLVIAYFGKRFFDAKAERSKMLGTLYFNKRLELISDFINVYNEAEAQLITLTGHSMVNKLESQESYQMKTHAQLLALRKKFTFLKLVLTKGEIDPFQKIIDIVMNHVRFSGTVLHDENIKPEIKEAIIKGYDHDTLMMLRQNHDIISSIADSFRKQFGAGNENRYVRSGLSAAIKSFLGRFRRE